MWFEKSLGPRPPICHRATSHHTSLGRAAEVASRPSRVGRSKSDRRARPLTHRTRAAFHRQISYGLSTSQTIPARARRLTPVHGPGCLLLTPHAPAECARLSPHLALAAFPARDKLIGRAHTDRRREGYELSLQNQRPCTRSCLRRQPKRVLTHFYSPVGVSGCLSGPPHALHRCR